MTPNEVSIVQNSFAKVAPISDLAADIFYDRLFELSPEVRSLFPNEMAQQKKKLMQMLTTAVNGLHTPDAIGAAVHDLGRRHASYNVKEEHYDLVGSALLYTLGKGLGDDFSAEVEGAWTEAYVMLATIMKEGQRAAG